MDERFVSCEMIIQDYSGHGANHRQRLLQCITALCAFPSHSPDDAWKRGMLDPFRGIGQPQPHAVWLPPRPESALFARIPGLPPPQETRSEEHTSQLQSHLNLLSP